MYYHVYDFREEKKKKGRGKRVCFHLKQTVISGHLSQSLRAAKLINPFSSDSRDLLFAHRIINECNSGSNTNL